MTKKELYGLAISAEIKAQNLYRALSKSFSKPEASTVFAQLIPYEEMHEAKLRELFALEFPGEELVLEENLLPDLPHLRIREPKDILEFAISKEEEANNIYISLANVATDESSKELMLRFATEELHHKTILFTEIQRMQGMIQWFDPSELNGMVEE